MASPSAPFPTHHTTLPSDLLAISTPSLDPLCPTSELSCQPGALTSCFSGAPEMRYSVLNRTGGLFPAEKLGLSVTFFLQGRTCQPQQDPQAPFLPVPQS